jgi:hypothetical protein
MELPLTRLNSEPATIFTPPWFYQKMFAFRGFCSKISFFYIFSTFDHLFKDLKVVHAILTRERQQTNMKSPRNLGDI